MRNFLVLILAVPALAVSLLGLAAIVGAVLLLSPFGIVLYAVVAVCVQALTIVNADWADPKKDTESKTESMTKGVPEDVSFKVDDFERGTEIQRLN